MYKHNSKKAIEEPRVIVYVLFTTVLVLAGIYVAFTYMGAIDIRFDFSDYNFRYNSAVARLIYSSQCYAYKDSYVSEDGQTYTQVHAGVLDLNEIVASSKIPETCIRGEQPLFVNITQYDMSGSATKYYTLYTGSSVPTDFSNWNSKELTFKVILTDGAKEYDGVMKLRLKK